MIPLSDAECLLAYIFLMKVELSYIKMTSGYAFGIYYGENFAHFIKSLAIFIYDIIHVKSSGAAEETLKNVLPSVYVESQSKAYHAVIDAYVKSGKAPVGPDQWMLRVSEALKNPSTTGRLNPELVSILKSFEEDCEVSRPYFYHIFRNYSLEDLQFKNCCVFWSKLVDDSFGKFAAVYRPQAQQILELVISDHPFASDIQGRFGIDTFLLKDRELFEIYLWGTMSKFFNGKWNEIFNSLDPVSAEGEFHTFLEKYIKAVSYVQDSRSKYACMFLMNLDFRHIWREAPKKLPYDFFEYVLDFSRDIYCQLDCSYPEDAQNAHEALRKICPTVYDDRITGCRDYGNVMEAYIRELHEWTDPESFEN